MADSKNEPPVFRGKKIEDGGRAFPQTTTESYGGELSVDVTGGMSKREHFAAQAIGAACTFAFGNISQASDMGLLPEEWAAKIAVRVADEMIISLKAGE